MRCLGFRVNWVCAGCIGGDGAVLQRSAIERVALADHAVAGACLVGKLRPHGRMKTRHERWAVPERVAHHSSSPVVAGASSVGVLPVYTEPAADG